jgi:hypothetical protein
MEWLSVSGDFIALSSIDWELLVRLLIQCGLFCMSAFFSGSETALFSLSRIDLQKLRNSRNPTFRKHPRDARRAAATDRLAALRQRAGQHCGGRQHDDDPGHVCLARKMPAGSTSW